MWVSRSGVPLTTSTRAPLRAVPAPATASIALSRRRVAINRSSRHFLLLPQQALVHLLSAEVTTFADALNRA